MLYGSTVISALLVFGSLRRLTMFVVVTVQFVNVWLLAGAELADAAGALMFAFNRTSVPAVCRLAQVNPPLDWTASGCGIRGDCCASRKIRLPVPCRHTEIALLNRVTGEPLLFSENTSTACRTPKLSTFW